MEPPAIDFKTTTHKSLDPSPGLTASLDDEFPISPGAEASLEYPGVYQGASREPAAKPRGLQSETLGDGVDGKICFRGQKLSSKM